MKHTKRLQALEGARVSVQNDLRGWICVAMPAEAPNTFTMARQDGTRHTVTAAQLAEIAPANATDGGPGVIILDVTP